MTYAQRAKLRLLIALTLTTLTVLTLLFRLLLAPAADELMIAQLESETSEAINRAIDEQIAAGELSYARLVTLQTDGADNITAIEADMAQINRLKTGILFRIDELLDSLSVEELSVPLGSVFFPELISGWGPSVSICVLAVRNSDATFRNEFSSAGINQTLHRIMLDVCVEVTIMTWTGKQTVTVNDSVAVAETVIVGSVPATYIEMGDIE